MAESVKLPVIGQVNRRWVYVGGAAIAGFVGYAWWTRARGVPEPEVLPEDIPQDREPPATVVGTEDFTSPEAAAIINTNAEWYTAAVEYLVGTGGFEFAFTTVTLGKFLARRELTAAEADLVQAAKGAMGEPPQGGPWPIIRVTGPAAPSTPTAPTTLAAPVLRFGAGDPRNTYYQLSWTKVPGAQRYLVKRERGPGVNPIYGMQTGTTRRVGPLQRRWVYQYRVQAQATGKASSPWSNPVSWKVPAR
jgi:hypothetical protein